MRTVITAIGADWQQRMVAVAFAIVSVTALATTLQAAAAPTRVAIAYPSPRVAPLWLAQDLDFFGKYGLRGQSVLVRNNQMLTAGFASGDIDVAYTGGTTVLGGAAAGTELKLLAGFVSRGRGFLTVRPDIRKPADLSGKRFGVQSIGGTLWMYAMLTMEQLGLDPVRDKIQFIVVGDQTVMVRALESGVVDATVLTTRAYSLDLKKKGFNVMNEVFPAMASTGIVARKSFLGKSPATAENILKALIEAEYYLLAPSGKAQTIKTIMSRLKLSDPSLAEDAVTAGAQVKRFLILPKELDADDGELTRTQKVRRGFIAERYAPLVTALYDGSPEADISTEVTFEDGRKGTISARVKIRDIETVPVKPAMGKAA